MLRNELEKVIEIAIREFKDSDFETYITEYRGGAFVGCIAQKIVDNIQKELTKTE